MYQLIFVEPWPWWAAGIGIGLVVVALAALANRPLAVTSGVGNAVARVSRLPYFGRTEYRAENRWRLEFVLGIVGGAAIAALLAGRLGGEAMGSVAFQLGRPSQAVLLLAGGTLMGFGARLAGGCTSGHAIQGTALLQPASMVSTAFFMGLGALTVAALYAVGGLS
jgi:uncharacterized membrane protein YedE/YeeE